MFEARPPLIFKKHPQKREPTAYTGIAQYANLFETEKPPKVEGFEAPLQRKRRLLDEVERLNKEKNELLASSWDPQQNPDATS